MNTLNINFKFFNSQKAHSCARPRRLSHRTQKSAEGSNLGEFLKKGIWLQKFLRIFHLFAEKPPPCADLHAILREGSSRRRNQPCRHLSQSGHGFWFCGGRIFGFPIRKRSRR